MARRRDRPERLLARGDRAGAVRGFRGLARRGEVEAMFQLGTLLSEDGDPEGLQWLRQAHERSPDDPAIVNNLGHALRQAGHLEEATGLFEAAVARRPDAPALYGLATVHVKAGRLAEAEPLLARAVAADPSFVIAIRQRADVLEGLGRHAEALEALNHALTLAPRHAPTLRKAGLVHAFVGRRSVAVAMLRQALSIHPDDPLAAHMLAALTGVGRERADDGYVRELFDAFADTFDTHLQDVLGYRVPERLVSLVPGPHGRVLDLGCGTGLLAPHLDPSHLVGVDLSEGMLARARARGGYDELHAESIDAFLSRTTRRFDTVLAADVFVYVGTLDEVFRGVAACCDGRFAFTTELTDDGVQLLPSGRYAHAEAYVDALAEAHGFRIADRRREVLRSDGGTDVEGQLVVLER